MPKEKETLSDKISAFLTSAPSHQLSDEEDETAAKVCPVEEDEEDYETHVSSLRKQASNLLEDDVKYAGKKCSRKELQDSDGESLDQSEPDVNIDSDFVESCESDNNEDLASDDENVEEEENSDVDQSNDENDAETNFKNISASSGHNKKGQSVKNQLQIWENLLEMRIQLQKSAVSSNKLPIGDLFKEFLQEKEFSENAEKTKNTLMNTLNKLLDLQKTLLGQYGETKKLLKQSQNQENDNKKIESDEEILSDTDEENNKLDDEESDNELPVKKRKLNEFENDIKQVHNKYKKYRDQVINQWNEKTRLDTKSLANNSVLDQINHILSDKDRLVRRSQLKKSDFVIIGEKTEEEMKELKEKRFVEEHNSNIYDDDDFYHQLLRELIEVKSADLTDPVQLSRQWVQLQNLRSKMKRKIDTKCTKGRKIRYTVHNKLVNFMAPIDPTYGSYDTRQMVLDSIFK